ncbi:MAG TPA: TlpA disulfide reductase family protein [Bryobacteraceae bacterium]|nr:TlpA disulfide reductase family protein [Bryobacteraceae bacterium]
MLPVLLAALSLSAGDAAPPLSRLELLNGTGLPRNAPMVVEFWATWCGPCVEQIPRWNSLALRFKGQVQFVAVSAEDPETVTEFLKKRPMAGWVALDLEGTVHQAYGVEGIPRTFLVDARGVVRAVTTISALREADLEALVAGRALQAQAKPPGSG